MDIDNNVGGVAIESTRLLGQKHTGMRVSASGLLGRIARGERPNKGTRYMLGELLNHLQQVGREYYAGNVTIVDEFLQCYALDDNRPNASHEPARKEGGNHESDDSS